MPIPLCLMSCLATAPAQSPQPPPSKKEKSIALLGTPPVDSLKKRPQHVQSPCVLPIMSNLWGESTTPNSAHGNSTTCNSSSTVPSPHRRYREGNHKKRHVSELDGYLAHVAHGTHHLVVRGKGILHLGLGGEHAAVNSGSFLCAAR